jgi:hypothetical protein
MSSLLRASAVDLPALPQDCIPVVGSQPQIGVYATFTGNATINSPYGQIAKATLTGWVCGIATVINRPPGQCVTPPGQYASVQLDIPANGVNVTIPSVDVTMIPGLSIPITHISVLPVPITAIICGVAAPGPIKQTVTAALPAETNTFAARCVLAATVPVNAEIYGRIRDFTISGSNGAFTLPAIQASSNCPSNLTAVANKLLALPLAQPASEITINGTGVAYQP